MTPFENEVTIAITVYDRRNYIEQAIDSALAQTLPVRVMIVEDCGPDPGLRKFICDKYGARVVYHRNERNRGLFDNWNACLELCPTRFLSILHDDDFLAPDFVTVMKDLTERAPGRGLYFGQADVVNAGGKKTGSAYPPIATAWREVPLTEFLKNNMVSFPGQLMPVAAAREAGGFRPTSLYCGDVEMWTKLTARFGAAQTGRTIAFSRDHFGWGRGTSRIERTGKIGALLCTQQKRAHALCRAQGLAAVFNRREFLRNCPLPTKSMLRSARFYSQRFLRYNYQLLLESQPPNVGYALFQKMTGFFGPKFLRATSHLYRLVPRSLYQ